MNPRTGAGVFSTALLEGVRKIHSDAQFTILTSEDLIPPSKWGIIKNFFAIRRSLAGCDIVHALDGFPYGVVASLASIGLGKPLIITAIGTGATQKLSHPLYGVLLKAAYRAAQIVTTPARITARQISKAVPGVVVEVVPHGVGTLPESSLELPQEIEKPYILSVGAIKRRKGYHISIPAFAKLARKNSSLSYVIVGNPAQSPEYFIELKECIEREGVAGRVRFLHGLGGDALQGVYRNAEAFVLLPQNVNGDVEGFGLVFLEAARAGLPVVASKDTSAEDAVREGKTGYLVDGGDPAAVADAIEKILDNSVLRATLSSESKTFAQEMSWDTQIKKYLALYAKL